MSINGKYILHLLYNSENIGKNRLQMVNELQNLTQTQRVAELLAEIAKDITAENRKEITQKLSISNTTLSKYLNGKVADVETGIGILQYCRAILVRREKDIAA